MTDYRYVFGTLLSEQVIDEISCYGVIIDMEMNNGGVFQGTFQLDQTGKDNDTMMSACTPGRTWIAVERNGTCIWHGFVWSRVYSAQSKSVQLYAQSFDKYPTKRRVETDLTYVGVEQRNIFVNLWTTMQSDFGSNMNINIPAATYPNAVLKSLEVLASDGKYYNSLMSSLADSANGFDWYISVTKDGTFYRKDLLVGYPQLGTNPFQGMVVFEFPGNITQYYYTEAMATAGTNVFVVGEGEGSSTIIGTYVNEDMLNTGSPRWDVDISRKDVSDQALIDDIAAQEGLNRQPPMPVIKVLVKANLDPVFGSYNLGDTCGIYIKDPRFPGNGIQLRKRLLRWELRPQSSDNTEEVNLTFEGDPDV